MTTTTLPLTLEEANHIRLKQGEFFGYPKCCVHSFINYMSGKGKRTPLQNKTSHPEGFIPCHKHATQIHMGEITVIDIIQVKKRICSIPFTCKKTCKYYIEIEKNDEFKEWMNTK